MRKGTPPPKQAEFRVRVTPRAAKPRWEPGDPVRVWVTAPPSEGQANDAVVRLIAGALGVAPSRVSVVRGANSRDKLLRVEGITDEEAHLRLRSP